MTYKRMTIRIDVDLAKALKVLAAYEDRPMYEVLNSTLRSAGVIPESEKAIAVMRNWKALD